jgi:hypothetical protein
MGQFLHSQLQVLHAYLRKQAHAAYKKATLCSSFALLLATCHHLCAHTGMLPNVHAGIVQTVTLHYEQDHQVVHTASDHV